jgi:hypothetical protein
MKWNLEKKKLLWPIKQKQVLVVGKPRCCCLCLEPLVHIDPSFSSQFLLIAFIHEVSNVNGKNRNIAKGDRKK